MTDRLKHKAMNAIDELIEYKQRSELRRQATGPVLIKGTPNVSLKNRSQKHTLNSTISKDVGGTPILRSNYEQRSEEHGKRAKGYDDFAAFEWEEMDREVDRDWYDQEEGGDYIDENNADR